MINNIYKIMFYIIYPAFLITIYFLLVLTEQFSPLTDTLFIGFLLVAIPIFLCFLECISESQKDQVTDEDVQKNID